MFRFLALCPSFFFVLYIRSLFSYCFRSVFISFQISFFLSFSGSRLEYFVLLLILAREARAMEVYYKITYLLLIIICLLILMFFVVDSYSFFF